MSDDKETFRHLVYAFSVEDQEWLVARCRYVAYELDMLRDGHSVTRYGTMGEKGEKVFLVCEDDKGREYRIEYALDPKKGELYKAAETYVTKLGMVPEGFEIHEGTVQWNMRATIGNKKVNEVLSMVLKKKVPPPPPVPPAELVVPPESTPTDSNASGDAGSPPISGDVNAPSRASG